VDWCLLSLFGLPSASSIQGSPNIFTDKVAQAASLCYFKNYSNIKVKYESIQMSGLQCDYLGKSQVLSKMRGISRCNL